MFWRKGVRRDENFHASKNGKFEIRDGGTRKEDVKGSQSDAASHWQAG